MSSERTAEWLDDSSITASASSNREEWSNEDTEVVEKRIGQVQKCPLQDCGKALVALCLGQNMSWGTQSLGIAPRSIQVSLLSQSRDNTLCCTLNGT